ncbi:MAG: NACHT domain-containing protein [Bryobacteraceae bacterium]
MIEGDAGSGKTTFLRRIAWALCRKTRDPQLDLHGFAILIRVRQLDEHISQTLRRPKAGDPTLADEARWVAHFLASRGWGLDESFWNDKLNDPQSVLLVDGLDEAVNRQCREEIADLFTNAAARWECHMVVTTRPGAYEGRVTLTGWSKTTIAPLDLPGIEKFLLQWCMWLKGGAEETARPTTNPIA